MIDAYRAVSALYQALMTGLVLTLVTRRGPEAAERFVFGHFRRQHLEKFLPGLAKLGLTGLPHAVACAQYHYLSNLVGGVKVEIPRHSTRGTRSGRARSRCTPGGSGSSWRGGPTGASGGSSGAWWLEGANDRGRGWGTRQRAL